MSLIVVVGWILRNWFGFVIVGVGLCVCWFACCMVFLLFVAWLVLFAVVGVVMVVLVVVGFVV